MTIVEAHDEHDGLDAWSFADEKMAYVYGPYFHAAEEFTETVFLHFESLYVKSDCRRDGVAARLIDEVAAVGLPTFCQFAAPFLPKVFERWSADADDEERWEITMNSPAGSLCSVLELASDASPAPPAERESFGLRLAFRATELDQGIRSVDSPEGELHDDDRPDTPEGTPESDVLSPGSRTWNAEDIECLPWALEENLQFQLSPKRSGCAVESIELTTDPPIGPDGRFTVTVLLAGEIINRELFLARAAWRHFLSRFDDEWAASAVDEAVAEICRSRYFELEAVGAA